MSTLLIVLLAASTAGLGYACNRLLASRRSSYEYARLQGEELHACKNELAAIRAVLDGTTGGVGKRIIECRETVDAIFTHAPGAYTKAPSLIYWLEATDQFLVELQRVAHLDPVQDRIASPRSPEVYERVHDVIGLPRVGQ